MSRLKVFSREDGFSLLELMIVIVIIGILVSIAVISFVVSVSASKNTVCKANLRLIEGEILVYRSRNDVYPPGLSDLVPEYIEEENDLYCPQSGEKYDYDPDTGEVSCPYHAEP